MRDRPMRIVLLSERLDRPVSGAYADELARALHEAGHEVFLIVRELPEPGAGRELPARLCRQLNAWTTGGSMREFLLGELRAFGAEVVHAADPALGIPARDIAKRLGRPSLVTVHATGARGWSPVDLVGHHVLAMGAALADDLSGRLGIASGDISVGRPGVRVLPGRLAGPMPEGRTPVIGAAGALEYSEGHRTLLEAARKLIDGGTAVQLLIEGSGPEKPGLRRLASELNLNETLTFAEDAPRLREVIDVMDIFVEPTLRDVLNPMMLEAMAEAKPVAASDSRDAMEAARDGRTALVFAKGDAGALAAALKRLLGEPELALRLGREARELVRRDFTVEAMVCRATEVYRRLSAR